MWIMVFFWSNLVSQVTNQSMQPTAASVDCQLQFVRNGDHCYYIAVDVWLRLPNADNTCKAMRSSLVGIETRGEFNFLTQEVDKIIRRNPRNPFTTSPIWRQQFWTSGHREQLGWNWGSSAPRRYNLTKYETMTFQDWYEGEPSEVYEQGVTAMYKRGRWGWNDFVTLDDLSFVCEMEKYGNEGCPNDFREFNQSCYLFVGDNDMSQARATLYCNGLGTHLVAIETATEWDFIKRGIEDYVVASGKSMDYEQWWTGGKQYDQLAAVTVNDVAQMWFHWDVTISQVPSALWYPYHPLAKPERSYLTLYYKDMKWYWLDEPRDSNLHYICKYMRKGNVVCKRGWIQKEKNCYLIPPYATRNRHAAEASCMKSGSRLVSITSREELEFVKSRLTVNNLPDGAKWWTGGLPIQGTWVWSENYSMFGDGAQNMAWSPGEPNNWDDKENRTTLSLREGQWGLNDVPIESHVVLPFICEAKLDSGEDNTCPTIVGRNQITRLPRTGGTWANLILNSTFNCPGRVSRWRYYRSNTEFSVYAGVWRPGVDAQYMLVGQVEFPVTASGQTEVTASPITVLPGDVLGIHYSRSAEAGVIAHAIAEDRAVNQNELSKILVLELHEEDMAIGESVDANLHTISGNEQCLSIQTLVSYTI